MDIEKGLGTIIASALLATLTAAGLGLVFNKPPFGFPWAEILTTLGIGLLILSPYFVSDDYSEKIRARLTHLPRVLQAFLNRLLRIGTGRALEQDWRRLMVLITVIGLFEFLFTIVKGILHYPDLVASVSIGLVFTFIEHSLHPHHHREPEYTGDVTRQPVYERRGSDETYESSHLTRVAAESSVEEVYEAAVVAENPK